MNRNFEYDVESIFLKPDGLWLSDESNGSGWSDWCKCEEFRIGDLKYKTKFYVEDEKCICLNSYEDIFFFNEEYRINFSKTPNASMITIDWERVKEQYSGIIITPYCFDLRLDFIWYYGWDCESACIWDTSILKLG